MSLRVLAGVVVLAAVFSSALEAQRGPRARLVEVARPGPEIGFRAGYGWDLDAWSLGAQLRLPITREVEIIPSADYELVDWATLAQANLDVAILPGRRRSFYFGGGAAFMHENLGGATDATTRVRPNVFAGFTFGRARRATVRPFAEARWTFLEGNESEGRVVFGLNAALGRR